MRKTKIILIMSGRMSLVETMKLYMQFQMLKMDTKKTYTFKIIKIMEI